MRRHTILAIGTSAILAAMGLLVLMAGCGKDVACVAGEKKKAAPVVLRIANWEDYLAPDTLSKFTERTGIQVQLETFPDEDVLVSRFQSDPARYDVIFPSRDRLCLLLRMKLLAPLPVEQLTNRRNIDPEYLKLPCDRRAKYFAPYLMGSTGLGYNDRYVQGPVDSWRELLNPKWGKRAAFLNNGDEVLAVALKLMGQSANAADHKTIFQAGEMLAPIVHGSRGLLDPIQIRDLLAFSGYVKDAP